MSTVQAPLRPRLRPRRFAVSVSGRLLRIELRRNAMIWVAPVMLALFYVTTYRPVMALPALWGLRTLKMQADTLLAFAPFVAGAAAWMGSREGRRDTTEIVATTARPRWSGQLATWAATTGWALVIYLLCVAVLYGVTASQASSGGPQWWPALVDAAWIVAFSALGFAAGALFSSRFAAPLAAVITVVALEIAFHVELPAASPGALNSALNVSPYSLTLPTIGAPLIPFNAGIYYPFLPDLSIVQTILGAGLAAAALGALGLRGIAGGGRRLRAWAVTLAVAGLAAIGVAIALAGTAVPDAHGMITIPAIHDSADDQPTPYTPACSNTAIPVCVHPAFQGDLSGLARTLAPVEHQVAGLPGVPVSINLAASAGQQAIQTRPGTFLHNGLDAGTITDTPPVFDLSFNLTEAGLTGQRFDDAVIQSFVAAVIGGTGNSAQSAIQGALMHEAGIALRPPNPTHPLPPNEFGLPAPARAAAGRFSALPTAAQRAWLTSHWSALRAGHITLAEIP